MEIFWKNVQITEGCWTWNGHKDRDGYGISSRPKVMGPGSNRAHRIAYEAEHGSIPSGHLDHLCRNRACVRPSHLEPVTAKVNAERGMKAQQTHCRHGHEFNEENTYRKPNGTRSCRRCHNENEKTAEARERRAAYAKEWRTRQKKSAPDPELAARSVLSWLQKKSPDGPLRARDVMKGVGGQKWCASTKDVHDALAALEHKGAIRFLPAPERQPGKSGRSPAPRFEVLPEGLAMTPE